MTIKLWGYSKCGTCRDALKWLQRAELHCEFIDIISSPPDVAMLTKLVQLSGLPLSKFFNTSGELYRELQLKDKLVSMSEEQQLQLLATHGKLVKRPLCTDGQRVTVGFKAEQFATIWRAGGGN
jgi:arsenate reductase